jgi:hypothetical protein
MDAVETVLAHYGVKGMKWGVHRSRSAQAKAHPDAIVAKRAKEKVKKDSVDSLSNEELRQLVTRLNLEKQFDTLKPATPGSRSKRILAETLVGVGKQQATKAINDQASKRIALLLAKAASG